MSCFLRVGDDFGLQASDFGLQFVASRDCSTPSGPKPAARSLRPVVFVPSSLPVDLHCTVSERWAHACSLPLSSGVPRRSSRGAHRLRRRSNAVRARNHPEGGLLVELILPGRLRHRATPSVPTIHVSASLGHTSATSRAYRLLVCRRQGANNPQQPITIAPGLERPGAGNEATQ